MKVQKVYLIQKSGGGGPEPLQPFQLALFATLWDRNLDDQHEFCPIQVEGLNCLTDKLIATRDGI